MKNKTHPHSKARLFLSGLTPLFSASKRRASDKNTPYGRQNPYLTARPVSGLLLAGILVCCQLFASTPLQIEQEAQKTIEQLYHNLDGLHKPAMSERIEWVSAQFKNKPYLLGALGEGPSARFDQFPRYRTDAFDCATYVTTVLAIALASNTRTFEHCLQHVRYKNGRRSYINRNHFTSLDWNGNNQAQGFLQDITLRIKDGNDRPIARIARATINKPAWYQYKGMEHIRLHPMDPDKQQNRLAELKSKGQSLEIREAQIPYLPLDQLFDAKRQANLYLFKQIPHGSIIEIVRPNWDLSKKIGTCLNVSHIGFAIWSEGILYYREASSSEGKIIDIPLITYLKQALDSPTIKGINVQVVKPQAPFQEHCQGRGKKKPRQTTGS